MADRLRISRGETEAHLRLKRLALIWAQMHSYTVCALEVHLPRCRFRADVAAFRSLSGAECAAVFECKQSLADLRRDNCDSAKTGIRLAAIERRRQTIERNLHVHYPALCTHESLFRDFDVFDFSNLSHRGYARVTRDGAALRQRLIGCTKFEKLARYRCANLFYIVIARHLREVVREIPSGWGLLAEADGELELVQKPIWQQTSSAAQRDFLIRAARAATRALNRHIGISSDDLSVADPGNKRAPERLSLNGLAL